MSKFLASKSPKKANTILFKLSSPLPCKNGSQTMEVSPLRVSKILAFTSRNSLRIDGVYIHAFTIHGIGTDLGPVVQSIVSLTSSSGGQLVKCFTTL